MRLKLNTIDKVVMFLDEKEKLSKSYENQVDTLTAQLDEMKIKIENSETLKKEAHGVEKQTSFFTRVTLHQTVCYQRTS
jgi:hypothetical protein